MTMRQLVWIAIVLVVAATGADAQRPAFEVASVKRNLTGSSSPIAFRIVRPQPGGRVVAVDTPLEQLVRFAYSVKVSQTVDGDARVLDESFDVTAKAPEDTQPSRDVLRAMMQSLLAERFKLRVRWESREQSAFALVRSRRDGGLGPRLRPSRVDCVEKMAAAVPNPDEVKACSVAIILGEAHVVGQRMDVIADFLSVILKRTVLDRTGLEGPFDFDLTTTAEDLPLASGRSAAPPGEGPSIYTALPEQLGLKLESQRLPVPVLVVEHVEALIEN